MVFKVSKKKFIRNELLISVFILTVLSIILRRYFHFTYFIFMFFWIFIYKEINHYNDVLYINGKCIKLKKYKRYSTSRRYASKIVEEEYNVISLEKFKESYNQFVLYGNIGIRKTINKSKLFSVNEKIEEYKTVEKLIIRKNFENEKEIKDLLKCAVESN